MKLEHEINFLSNITFETSNGVWVDIQNYYKMIVYIDPTKFVNPTFYFESTMDGYAASQISIRLVRIADASVKAQIDKTTDGGGQRLRTSGFTLTAAEAGEYKIQVKAIGATSNFYTARVIVIDDFTALTKEQHQIPIGGYHVTTSELYVDPICPFQWLWWDYWQGTKTVEIEAVLYSSKANKPAYLKLCECLDETQVICELSVDATVPTRVRSAPITLGAPTYKWQIHGSGGNEGTVVSVTIIVTATNATGSIHTRLHKRIEYHKGTTGTTCVTGTQIKFLYTKENYLNTVESTSLYASMNHEGSEMTAYMNVYSYGTGTCIPEQAYVDGYPTCQCYSSGSPVALVDGVEYCGRGYSSSWQLNARIGFGLLIIDASTIRIKQIQEFIKCYDSVQASKVIAALITSVNEFLQTYDAYLPQIIRLRQMEEFIQIFDAISATPSIAALITSVNEFVQCYELSLIHTSFARQFQEFSAPYDQSSSATIFSRDTYDYAALHDISTLFSLNLRTIIDYLTLYDAVSTFLRFIRTILDTIAVYDSLETASVFSIVISDYTSILDIISIIESCLDMEYVNKYLRMLENLYSGWSIAKALEAD